MADSLLPPNATAEERSLETATARIGDVPVPIDTLWNPAACPVSHLPWLAWALSVDTWNPDWPEATKRRVIAASVEIHRKKGTVGAVKGALAALGAPPEVVEWWQVVPETEPGTFVLTTWANDADPALTFDPAYFADALAMIDDAKRHSQHPTFRVGARLDGGLGLANVAVPRQRHKVSLHPAGGMRAGLSLGAAGAAANVSHAVMVIQ